MARLYSSGFELNSVTAGMEWGEVTGSPTISSTTPRSGTYKAVISSLSSGTRKAFRHDFASIAEVCVRVYVNFQTLPSAENRIIALNTGATGYASHQTYLSVDNSGVLKLYNTAFGGQIGSSSSALNTNQWYYLEIHHKNAGATTGLIEARIDGVGWVSVTGFDVTSNVRGLVIGGNLNTEAQTTGTWWFDDIAINDVSGSFQNSWAGEGEIIHLRPNAAGDNNQIGAAAGSNNYQDVDEVTPDDGSTYRDTQADSAGEIDDYNIDATPAAMDTTDIINCVQVGVRFASAGGSPSDTIVLRVKAAASGTTEESSSGISPTSTTFATNAVSVPRNYPAFPNDTNYQTPGTANAWTKSDLDQSQIGFRKSADSTWGVRVSAMWLLVDHKPAAPSTSVKDTIGMGILPFAR
jgi:hypothetical protein